MAKIIQAFTDQEKERARKLLASKVATMMGRKLEEGDWLEVYCLAKKIPLPTWSNLNIDVNFQGLGVEHKMIRRASDVHLLSLCGTTIMHPAATRSIRVATGEANAVMRDVLEQYAQNIGEHRKRVAQDSINGEVDLRIGWLIWRTDLFEFLYFEEEWVAPDPSSFFAEWHESRGGTRKPSKNLWVFENATGKKRFSITTSAGAKIQPYFDVPAPNSPHLYYFRVQGEPIAENLVRLWVLPRTAKGLEQVLGALSVENLSNAILTTVGNADGVGSLPPFTFEEPIAVIVTKEAYDALIAGFQGKSDEHSMELLLDQIGR